MIIHLIDATLLAVIEGIPKLKLTHSNALGDRDRSGRDDRHFGGMEKLLGMLL